MNSHRYNSYVGSILGQVVKDAFSKNGIMDFGSGLFGEKVMWNTLERVFQAWIKSNGNCFK